MSILSSTTRNGFASVNGQQFLTGDQTTILIDCCRRLRIGHQLHKGAKAPYLVKVDGSWHHIRNITSLAKFLSCCTIPLDVEWFRNFDKGITINLDTDA